MSPTADGRMVHTCPWRITELSQNQVFFRILIPCQDVQYCHPCRSFDRYRRPASTPGRSPFRRCRVGAAQTSTMHPQSWPQACSQPARRRTYHRRFVHPLHELGTPSTFRHRPETFHSSASPPRSGEAKVPHVVFAQAQASAWSESTEKRTHRRSR